ncbi:MAG: ABC transporter ATP-binding protein [Candidatus Dormiibacterota bacterium]
MIEVQALTKHYGARVAISDVSFSVPRGQVLGFLGPNGAGKSTTMRILTGYLSATSGAASIAGFDVFSESREVRRRVGYLPELSPLYNEQRVRPFLEFMCRLRGVEPKRRRQLVDRAIESCGLAERRQEIIGRLSKGLRQRVGLAQAVVHDPDVLILDEPTAGLDPGQTRETRDLIVELGRNHTVILSSHILSEVQATCERVVIINEGHLVADDTPEGLRHRHGEEGAQVEVLVRGSRERVISVLQALPGVHAVTAEAAGDGEVEAVVSGEGADLQDLVAKGLVGADLGLRELRTRSRSLEDLFLEVVEEDPRDRRAAHDDEPPAAEEAEPQPHLDLLPEPDAPATDEAPEFGPEDFQAAERTGTRKPRPAAKVARRTDEAGWTPEPEDDGSWRNRPGAADDDA